MKNWPWSLIFLIFAILFVAYEMIDSIFINPQNYSTEDSYYDGAPAPWSSGPYSD